MIKKKVKRLQNTNHYMTLLTMPDFKKITAYVERDYFVHPIVMNPMSYPHGFLERFAKFGKGLRNRQKNEF